MQAEAANSCRSVRDGVDCVVVVHVGCMRVRGGGRGGGSLGGEGVPIVIGGCKIWQSAGQCKAHTVHIYPSPSVDVVVLLVTLHCTN